MTQRLAHKLPEDGKIYEEVPGAPDAPPEAAPPSPDPGAALIDRKDKLALGLVLLAGGSFYAALIAWLLG